MATIREKRPGVWEMRAFTGRDERGRPTQVSRAALVKADPIAQVSVARLSVADVDRWHTRLRRAGVGEGSIRNQHQAGPR